MTVEWRFAESEEDAQAWMLRPTVLHIYVDYRVQRSGAPPEWRRLMVGTSGWLRSQLAQVKLAEGMPYWIALPTLLIIPDAPSGQLREVVDAVMQQGGFDHYSTVIDGSESAAS